MNRPKPHHTLLALLILTLSMLVACLWPFEFHPPNDVVYLPEEQGLRFHGYGTAYSRDSFPALSTLSESNELTVDMTVRPRRVFNTGLPNILSFTAGTGQPALMIGAWKKSLIVRLARPESPGWRKYQEIGVDDVFAAGQTVHLVISLGPRGAAIFVDGKFARFSPAGYTEASNTPLGRLLLGNSPAGGSLWRGDFLALALYDRALPPIEFTKGAQAGTLPMSMDSGGRLIARYQFDNSQGNLISNNSGLQYDIVIPTYYSPLHPMVLELPRAGKYLTLWFLKDFVLNVLGFMPFGFLAMLSLGNATVISTRWQSTMVVLAGFSLSLFAELIQAYLPMRSSSLVDLATNTLGAACGVLVYFTIIAWWPKDLDEAVPMCNKWHS